MSRPKMRGDVNYYDGLADEQADATGTLNTSGATLIASPGAGKRILLKAFSFQALGNAVASQIFISDGTKNLPVGVWNGAPVNTGMEASGWVTIPGNGMKFAANTAVVLDCTANAALVYYAAAKYITVNESGPEG